MRAPAPMLELERIETYRGPAQILRSISLTVGAGEAVCLVGRNGAGKTTTIDTIMGLLPSRSGVVRFKGEGVGGRRAKERARGGVGYAPGVWGLFPDPTVGKTSQTPAWPAKEPPTAAPDGAIFAIFPEIKEFLTRRGLHLSGGQKKMLAITRALTLKPSVLLLDEPFEGLAPVIVTRFIEAVRAIKALGVSLLITESHVRHAVRIAHRLYPIDPGEIIFAGRPAQLTGNAEEMKTLHG